MKENLSIGLRLSLHRLLSRLHRYCASTLTTINVLIVEEVLSVLLPFRHKYGTLPLIQSAPVLAAFHVPHNLGLLPLRPLL